jgi:hypothetical protein
MRVSIRDGETGNILTMDVDQDHCVEDIIESAASYWAKSPGAYILRKGTQELLGQWEIRQAGVYENDLLELIPDPRGGA